MVLLQDHFVDHGLRLARHFNRFDSSETTGALQDDNCMRGSHSIHKFSHRRITPGLVYGKVQRFDGSDVEWLWRNVNFFSVLLLLLLYFLTAAAASDV